MSDHPVPAPTPADPCGGCALGRRAFLGAAALAAAGVASALGALPAEAAALVVRAGRPAGVAGAELTYRVPVADGAVLDATHEVLLVRWQGHLYAFSSRCPHQRAALEWESGARDVYCPKHKARFSPTGMHVSGRATRNLDRYPIRKVGVDVAVNTAVTYRDDTMPAAWSAAAVPV